MSQSTFSQNSFVIALVGGMVGALLAFGGLLTAISKQWITIAVSSQHETRNTESPSISTVSSFTDVSDLVENVNPSVVSIVIKKDVPILERYQSEDPFQEFFGGNSPFSFRIPQYRQQGTQEREVGGGSGFFISNDGYIVTNAHVVSDANATYSVTTIDETSYEADVIATDPVLDVALLKIEGTNFPVLTFGDSDALKLGQGVIAIGNALGEFRNTVSTGVISGLSRSITAGDGRSAEQLENVIQTDAAINPGNSGGPLLDREGNVIGVNVAVAGNSQNIGFSLPINLVRSSIESMKEHGRVIRPYLGVRYVPVTEQLKKLNQLPVDHGALVSRGETREELAVMPGSPADKAGLAENDVILEVDGVAVDQTHSLASLIRTKQVGSNVQLKIFHKGGEKILQIRLEEAPN